MPNPPAAKNLLAEAVKNGVLRRAEGAIEFLHETVQDFFAALAIFALPLPDIENEVPTTEWSVGENAFKEGGRTVLADALAMLSGLLDSSDQLIIGLLDKDPPLAAECLYGARAVSDSVWAAVIERCTQFLLSSDPVHRCLGCRCVRFGQLQTSQIVDAIRELAACDSVAVAVEALSAARKFDRSTRRSVAISTLARTRLVPVRIDCLSLLVVESGKFVDMALVLVVVPLADQSHLSEEVGIVGESSILKKVAALYRDGVALDELITMITQPDEGAAASLLIRLAYGAEAAVRIGEKVCSKNDSNQEVLLTAMLPIACGAPAVPVLMKLIRDSGDLTIAATAGVSLRYLATDLFNKSNMQSQFANLQGILSNQSLPTAARVGAALALIHDSEDRQKVLERFSDPSEARDLRMGFCDSCLLQPAEPAWLGSLSIGTHEIPNALEELVDFLMDPTLGDPDLKVRLAAAKALSRAGQGERKLLEKLNDPAAPPDVRGSAAAALGIAGHPAAREPLLKLLTDPTFKNWELAPLLIDGLAAVLDDATLQETLLTGPDEERAILPALILVRARQDAALDLIESWLLDSSLSLRSQRRALRVLRDLATKQFGLAAIKKGAAAKLIEVALC